MQRIALSWLVYRLTGSAVLLADRLNRHRIIVATQVVAMVLAFAMAGLTLTGAIEVRHILLLSGLLGMVNAFDIPACQSFVAAMVGRNDLPGAIALNAAMVNGARIAGPAAGCSVWPAPDCIGFMTAAARPGRPGRRRRTDCYCFELSCSTEDTSVSSFRFRSTCSSLVFLFTAPIRFQGTAHCF
jgi:MFS family permease